MVPYAGVAALIAVLSASMGGVVSKASEAPRASSHPFDARIVQLDPRPRSTFYGLWVKGGEELVLSDVLGGRLLRYHRDGTFAGELVRPGRGLLDFDRPVQLISAGDELVLLHSANKLVGLTSNLEPKWGVHLENEDFAGRERVTFLRSAVATDGGYVGLLAVTSEDGAPWYGFGKLLMGDAPRVIRIAPLEGNVAPGADLYSVVAPIVAEAGGSLFALRFEPEPHIQRLTPSVQRLKSFPEGFGRPPTLVGTAGALPVEARFRALEQASTPVSLLGRGDYLYLLTRKSAGEGRTEWAIHQIDPRRDALIRSMPLPLTGRHLAVVPGPSDWAFVQKGTLMPGGAQEIDTIVFIPSDAIEGGLPSKSRKSR